MKHDGDFLAWLPGLNRLLWKSNPRFLIKTSSKANVKGLTYINNQAKSNETNFTMTLILSHCGLNICGPYLQYICWNPTSSRVIGLGGGSFRRQLGLNQVMRVESREWNLYKIQERAYFLSLLSTWWEHREVSSLQQRSRSSPERDYSGTLTLDFLPPHIKNKFLFFVSHQVYTIFVYSSLN